MQASAMTRIVSRSLYSALLLLAAASSAWSLDPHRPLQQYGRRIWQTDNGLPQDTVHAILQTRDGYLWVGTEGGLVRFDGVNFATYDVENTRQLKSDTVYDLFQDRSGALWISTAGGLAVYREGRFHAYSTSDGLPAETVWFSYQDRRNRIWAITSAGPAFLAGGRFHPLPEMQDAAPPDRRGLAEDSGGRIWLASEAGLFAIDSNSPAPVAGPRLLKGVAVSAVAADGEGGLWIGSAQGLERYSGGSLQPVSLAPIAARTPVLALAPDGSGGLWVGTAAGLARLKRGGAGIAEIPAGAMHERIASLFADRQGALWIVTDRQVQRLAGGSIGAFPPGSGLSELSLLAIYEDREGDLWMGADSGGLYMLRDRKFTTYASRDGLSANPVSSVLGAGAGELWVGTNGGGIDRGGNGGFSRLPTRDRLASDVILSLAGSPGGPLWVGTPDGLNRIEGGSVRKFTSANGLPDDLIRSLFCSRPGELWIGTRRGLARLRDGKFSTYTAADGLGSDLIGAIVPAAANPGARGEGPASVASRDTPPAPGTPDPNLWIGTAGGLTHLQHGVFTNYTTAAGLSSNVITAIYPDAEGSVWLGTNGNGLNRMRGGRIVAFPHQPGGLPDTIYGILEDSRSNLWLSSRSGIFRVAKERLEAYARGSTAAIPVRSFGVADGMSVRECSSGHPAAWKMADGSLWFATLDGVASVDPEHSPKNPLPPPVVIEGILVDDRPRSLGRPLILQPGATRLELQYAGLSFPEPQRVRYRYRLEGFDRQWIDAGGRRSAFYTNLPPGRYRFHVVAANNDGVWNDVGAWVQVRMEPHFYQTYWFYALLALSSVLLATLGYRWRVRQVEAQFQAVLAERGRLAREIHDTLAQGFVGVSVQLELIARLLATSRESAVQQLDHARAMVRHCLEEARRSIWELRSTGASAEDLPARLARVCAVTPSESAAKVYLQVKGIYRPLAGKVENEMLRIGQEAVANALRHSGGRRVEVQLIYREASLLLEVQDDGNGFDWREMESAGPLGHFGLRGMRERAEQINAEFTVASSPGAGAKISVEAPLT